MRATLTVLSMVLIILLGRLDAGSANAKLQPVVSGAGQVDPQLTNTPTRTPTPVNIGNKVWEDLNGNGIQNNGEPGVAGVQVQLWNGTKTALLNIDTTDASGLYTVVAPTPGNYYVRVLLPPGATFTLKDQGADDMLDSDFNPSGAGAGFTDLLVLPSNLISTTTIDAGLRGITPPTATRTPTPVNIGNKVWEDLNGNGIQDATEPGVPFVQVQLWNGTKTALLNTDITDASGLYTVVAPTPGNYYVRVLLPPGATFTLKNQGADDLLDSDFNPAGAGAGFTDLLVLPSNLISTTTIDAGLLNVPANFTPTPTATSAATPTSTATATSNATSQPAPQQPYGFLPLLAK